MQNYKNKATNDGRKADMKLQGFLSFMFISSCITPLGAGKARCY